VSAQADRAGVDDLVGEAVLEATPVLVDARFMAKGIGTDDRFVWAETSSVRFETSPRGFCRSLVAESG